MTEIKSATFDREAAIALAQTFGATRADAEAAIDAKLAEQAAEAARVAALASVKRNFGEAEADAAADVLTGVAEYVATFYVGNVRTRHDGRPAREVNFLTAHGLLKIALIGDAPTAN